MFKIMAKTKKYNKNDILSQKLSECGLSIASKRIQYPFGITLKIGSFIKKLKCLLWNK